MDQILGSEIPPPAAGVSMNTDKIRNRLKINHIPFSDELPEKLLRYFTLLKDWNQKMDLTAVTDDDEMLDKHFIDSLTVLRTSCIPDNAALIDVGTGAGFPGMVLAMARNDLSVTLLDAQQKRLSFLNAVADTTDTHNVTLIHDRAETGARRPELREKFDVATARALAPLNVLCEYLLPYVRTGGCALCWKGPAVQEEMEAGMKAACLLGGRTEMPFPCLVAGRNWEHQILQIVKIRQTSSAYPRKAGIPKQKPLGI